MLGMFQMPNRFFEGGRTVDFLGNDWEQVWGRVHQQAALPSAAR
jgi:hypothetical protein